MLHNPESERTAKGGPCPPKAPQYQTGLFQGGEIKPRRAAYADGLTGRLTERRLISVTRLPGLRSCSCTVAPIATRDSLARDPCAR
jgi:hypothetical protein